MPLPCSLASQAQQHFTYQEGRFQQAKGWVPLPQLSPSDCPNAAYLEGGLFSPLSFCFPVVHAACPAFLALGGYLP